MSPEELDRLKAQWRREDEADAARNGVAVGVAVLFALALLALGPLAHGQESAAVWHVAQNTAAIEALAGQEAPPAQEDAVSLDVQLWGERAFTGEVATTIAGGRLAVEGPLAIGDQGIARLGGEFDVTALSGEATGIDFTSIDTIGTHAELRLWLSREVGRLQVGRQDVRTSVLSLAGFATALDRDPDPLQRYPRFWGGGLRFEERKSRTVLDVWYGRHEAVRRPKVCADPEAAVCEDPEGGFGYGQLGVQAEVPVGPVRIGGEFFLDLKGGDGARDLGRLSIGVSVPDLVGMFRPPDEQ